VRGGSLQRFVVGDALAGQLAATQGVWSRRREHARQNREGDSAAMTDAASNPDEIVPVIVSLPESPAVSDDGLRTTHGTATRQQAQWDHPGPLLSFFSGSAIKRITAGVKVRRDRFPDKFRSGRAFTLPEQSDSNEKRIQLCIGARQRGRQEIGRLRSVYQAQPQTAITTR